MFLSLSLPSIFTEKQTIRRGYFPKHEETTRFKAIFCEYRKGADLSGFLAAIGTRIQRLFDYIAQLQQYCESLARRYENRYFEASVPFARRFTEVLFELAFFTLVFIGIRRRIFLAGDVRPFGREFGV